MKLNKRGVTLVEVIVYMVVSVFVIGFAIETVTAMSKNFFQEKKKGSLQLNGQDAINMLAREIASTGFKHYLSVVDDSGDTTFTTVEIPGTWTSSHAYATTPGIMPLDMSASFFVTKDSLNDEIEIFKAVMADPNTIQDVRRIAIYLKDNNLMHEVGFFKDDGAPSFDDWSWNSNDVTILMSDVAALKFQFSEDFVTWIDDPETLGNRDRIQFVKIVLLIRSPEEGDVVNEPVFEVGEDTFKTSSGNKFLYRKYERIVEVPSNGKLM